MKLLVVSNIHRPLDRAWSAGMELSTYELLLSLHAKRSSNLSISVIAHPDTLLPPELSLLSCSPSSCDPHYAQYGDGPIKWETLAIEAELARTMNLHGVFDAILDQTSAISPAFIASIAGVPLVKTARLMPFHPSVSLTRDITTTVVHLTNYSRNSDAFSRTQDVVIRDYVGTPSVLPETTVAADRKYAVSIGRIEKRKGHHVAAQIAKKLNLPLKILGALSDIDYAASLKSIEGVELLGELDRPTTLAILKHSDTLIWTPCIPEPNGRVVVESLRLGVPVIGSNTGALADLNLLGSASFFDETLLYAEHLPQEWPTSPEQVADAYLSLLNTIVHDD